MSEDETRPNSVESSGPRFARIGADGRATEHLYPDDPRLAGLQLSLGISPGGISAGEFVTGFELVPPHKREIRFVLSRSETAPEVCCPVKGERRLVDGEAIRAGRQYFRFERSRTLIVFPE